VVVPSKLTGEQPDGRAAQAHRRGCRARRGPRARSRPGLLRTAQESVRRRIVALNVREGPDETHSGPSTTPIESAEPRRRHRYHLHIVCPHNEARVAASTTPVPPHCLKSSPSHTATPRGQTM
jgi:hypothetical protein